MGRPLSTNLTNRLADPSVETQSTLDLTLTNATEYHFSTDAFTGTNSEVYTADLRRIGEIKQSISQSIDRVEAEIQNIDKIFGDEVVGETLVKATAVVGRQYGRNEIHGSLKAWAELFRGEVRVLDLDENVARIEIINDLAAAGFCVSDWSLAENCQFVYKHAGTCGFAGAAATCNKRRKSPDGCAGKIVSGSITNEYRFGGMEFPDVQAATPPTGIDDPGDIGWGDPTCPRTDQYVLVRDYFSRAIEAKRVLRLAVGDELFNPVTGRCSRISSIEFIPNEPIFRLVTRNGSCGYSSGTHPIIRRADDAKGLALKNLEHGDEVLTWSNGSLAQATASIAGNCWTVGTVAQIELEREHIYAYSETAKGPFIVCHNSKPLEDGGPRSV